MVTDFSLSPLGERVGVRGRCLHKQNRPNARCDGEEKLRSASSLRYFPLTPALSPKGERE
jgi:hypothetical protein